MNEDSNFALQPCSTVWHGFNNRRCRQEHGVFLVIICSYFAALAVMSSGLCCWINGMNPFILCSALPPLCVVPSGNLEVSFWVCFYLFFKFVNKNSYFIVVAIFLLLGYVLAEARQAMPTWQLPSHWLETSTAWQFLRPTVSILCLRANIEAAWFCCCHQN